MLRIGTRDSQLALWQATRVQELLALHGIASSLVPIKSEGDIDLITPLYAMGVQGIFTRSLDIALLNRTIDLAVHSMKDVPVQLPEGLCQAAVLTRHNPSDLLVYKNENGTIADKREGVFIGTSSLRRRAQWLHRFPQDRIEPLRGNVNTRMRKLSESTWFGAIFAAAGLDRIGLRPASALELDWMIPAPAQGAIMVVCRQQDTESVEATSFLNDEVTAICTRVERDFLSALLGGCSTPIGALATLHGEEIHFRGNLLSPDGKQLITVERMGNREQAGQLVSEAAREILQRGGEKIVQIPASHV